MMMVVVMMVPTRCERRACTNQDQKCEEDKLLHALKSSTISICQYGPKEAGIKTAKSKSTVFMIYSLEGLRVSPASKD
jgi:hypothetical protein